MENGEWRMENGEWEWRVRAKGGSGKWRMKTGD
jgi:hypothetical protein